MRWQPSYPHSRLLGHRQFLKDVGTKDQEAIVAHYVGCSASRDCCGLHAAWVAANRLGFYICLNEPENFKLFAIPFGSL